MNYRLLNKLPPVEEIIQAIPLSLAGHKKIMQDREEVKQILAGRDDRLLMIVGPCSAWPSDAVLTYAHKLCDLNKSLQHAIKIIMRVYIQKPRTTKGWTGPVNQPDPLASSNIEAGMKYTRAMMVKVIEMGLPIADEALFTHNAKGFLELLTWVAMGARSSEDQEHRIFASMLNCPVGMKNPTHGSLPIAVNGVLAAQHAHVAALNGYEVETFGNEFAHLVLRGSHDGPNYSLAHIEEAKQYLLANQIKHPAILIDASHDNSLINGKKDHRRQPEIIFEVLENLKQRPDLKNLVKGFMVESFLQEGNQKINSEKLDLNGLSVTDPCLSWEQTEKMLLQLADFHEKGRIKP